MYWLRLFNRNILIYTLADGFYYGGYSVINAFLSVLITTSITHGRVDVASYVISYYLILRAITELPLANFIRRFSDKHKLTIVSVGYVIYGVLVLFMGFSTAVWQIFVLQTFIALIDATTYPIRWPMFAKIVDRGNEELEWGVEDVAGTILPAVFSAIAGIVAEAFGIASAFFVFGPVFMISGFAFAFIDLSLHPHRPKTPEHAREALEWIVGHLRAIRVKFEITGGLAAQLHGSRRPLADIDIDVHERTLNRLLPRVREYVVFGPARYKDRHRDLRLMTLRYKSQSIDICGVERAKIYDADKREWTPVVNDFSKRVFKQIFGMRLPVSTKEEVVEYKSKLRRLVDNMDIAQVTTDTRKEHLYSEVPEPPTR